MTVTTHRLLLLTVLGLGAAALAYNAASILQGRAGLAGLPALITGEPAGRRDERPAEVPCRVSPAC